MRVTSFSLAAVAALAPVALANEIEARDGEPAQLAAVTPPCNGQWYLTTVRRTTQDDATTTSYYAARATIHATTTVGTAITRNVRNNDPTTVTKGVTTSTITKPATTVFTSVTRTTTDTDDAETVTLDPETSTVSSSVGFTPVGSSLPTSQAKRDAIPFNFPKGRVCYQLVTQITATTTIRQPTFIIKPPARVTDRTETTTNTIYKTIYVGPTVTKYSKTAYTATTPTKVVTKTSTVTVTPTSTETPDAVVFYQACGASNLLNYTLSQGASSNSGASTGSDSTTPTGSDPSSTTDTSGSASSDTPTDGSSPSTSTAAADSSTPTDTSTGTDGTTPDTNSNRAVGKSAAIRRRAALTKLAKRDYTVVGINSVALKTDGTVTPIVSDDADTAEDCCIACQNNALCAGSYFTPDNTCNLLVSNSCSNAQQWLVGSYQYDPNNAIDVEDGTVVSNGNCGGWSYGGASS